MNVGPAALGGVAGKAHDHKGAPLGASPDANGDSLARFFAQLLAFGPVRRRLRNVCKSASSVVDFESAVIVAVSDAGCDFISAGDDVEAASLKGCERWEGLRALGDAPVLVDQILPVDASCA